MEFSVDATLSQVLNSKTRYPISQRQRGRPVVESNGCRVTNRAVEGSLTCAAEKERGKKAEGGGKREGGKERGGGGTHLVGSHFPF